MKLGLDSRDFEQLNVDHCGLLIKDEIILVYVDDCIIFFKDSEVIKYLVVSLQNVHEKFILTDEVEIENYLSV